MILESPTKLVAQHFTTDDVNQLVQAARAGSEEAFEGLIRMYHLDVRLFLLRYLGSPNESDEVAQEVFIEVFKSISQFKGTGSIKSWILGIARNRAMTHLKKEITWRKKHSSNFFDEISQSCINLSNDQVTENENWNHELMILQNCLKKLTPPHHELIQQFYFEKRSADAIGQQTGKKPGAVRMLLMRIRKSLEKCMRKSRQQGEPL